MYKKELLNYFTGPIAYIVIGLFLLLISLFLWVIPGEWNIVDSGYAQTDGLFRLTPWLFLFLCPALTMRMFAEERQKGTWQMLLTKPVSLTRIVTAKFLAAWTLVVIALLPCLIHLVAVYNISEPRGNVDVAAFFGSFAGLLFVSMSFTAIGTFASAFSKNQIVCFIVSAAACAMFFFGFDLLASFPLCSDWVTMLQHIGGNKHFLSLERGVIELADVVYFLVVSVFFVSSTIVCLQHRYD